MVYFKKSIKCKPNTLCISGKCQSIITAHVQQVQLQLRSHIELQVLATLAAKRGHLSAHEYMLLFS